jgi:hypothetical protein
MTQTFYAPEAAKVSGEGAGFWLLGAGQKAIFLQPGT